MAYFTDGNGEHRNYAEKHHQGKTLQQQKNTVKTPLDSETAGTEQHQSILDSKKTAEQV